MLISFSQSLYITRARAIAQALIVFIYAVLYRISFHASEQAEDEENANQVGKEVCPQETLPEHHVADECAAEGH